MIMNKEQLGSLAKLINSLYYSNWVSDVQIVEVFPQYKNNEYQVFFSYKVRNKRGQDNVYCNFLLEDNEVQGFKTI